MLGFPRRRKERWAAECSTSPSFCSGETSGTRVTAVALRFHHHFVRPCLGLAAWRMWCYEHGYSGCRIAIGGADAECHGASCGSQCFRSC